MDQEPTPENQKYIGARKVDQKGRITIPSGDRDALGLSYDDEVSLTVETIPDDPFEMRDVFDTATLTVRTRGQVTIPADEREVHDIQHGDRVNVLVTAE